MKTLLILMMFMFQSQFALKPVDEQNQLNSIESEIRIQGAPTFQSIGQIDSTATTRPTAGRNNNKSSEVYRVIL